MQPGKPMVANKKFALMLKHLLSESIPQADIDFVKALPADALFIDTRSENEHNVSSISGAIKAGFENFDINLLKSVNKTRLIIVFCSVGLRSEKLCRILLEEGYTNVYNLYGGIFEWVNQGLPVVDSLGYPVKVVHAFSPLWGIWVNGVKKVYG